MAPPAISPMYRKVMVGGEFETVTVTCRVLVVVVLFESFTVTVTE